MNSNPRQGARIGSYLDREIQRRWGVDCRPPVRLDLDREVLEVALDEAFDGPGVDEVRFRGARNRAQFDVGAVFAPCGQGSGDRALDRDPPYRRYFAADVIPVRSVLRYAR